jgi:Na+/H+-dicarboxylate symporter
VVLTKFFAPGAGLSLSLPVAKNNASTENAVNSVFSFNSETLLNILPINPLSSFVEGQMLDVVILSLIAGIALLSIDKKQAGSVLDVLGVIQQVCMKIISWAMKLAPLAVFGMMAQVTATTGLKSLQNMLYYVLVCFLGFTCLIFFYAILVMLLKKTSPFKFLKAISSPMLLAFSTSSSAATMPLSLKVAEDELDINPSSARFLIPLGATVNMAGSAIWHTSAVIFLSQVYNLDLSFAQISIVVATSIASAIGSPGVPGVGVGILASVLVKVGIPIEGVSLIMGVDRVIDMGCTVVNVTGDLTAAKVLSKNGSVS